MRRAAVSIPSNIAEGYGRKSSKEYAQHLSIAFGSALELETQLLLSKKLSFEKEDAFEKTEELMDEVVRMLNKMTITNKKI